MGALAALAVVSLLLVACGQRGPLVLPSAQGMAARANPVAPAHGASAPGEPNQH